MPEGRAAASWREGGPLRVGPRLQMFICQVGGIVGSFLYLGEKITCSIMINLRKEMCRKE